MKHVLQPAVGLYSMGDEVLVRGSSVRESNPPPEVVRHQTHWTEPMYSNRQSPCVFTKRPNEVVAETYVKVDVVPAGSWASYQDPPTRKRFRRVILQDVVRTGSWTVRGAGGSRTHLNRFAGGCRAVWLQRQFAMSSPGVEPGLRPRRVAC